MNADTELHFTSKSNGLHFRLDRGDVLFPTSGETIEEIGKSAVSLECTRPVVCGGVT